MGNDFDDREAEVMEDLEKGLIDEEEYQEAMDDISDERDSADSEADVNSELEELQEESDADDFDADNG